jgi:hypothetical protein
MDQTKTTTARRRRRRARGLSSLFVGGALSLMLMSSAASAQKQEQPDELERLENKALSALADKRLLDAFDVFRLLHALSGDPRDACNAGGAAYSLGNMLEAFRFLVICAERQPDPAWDSAREQKVMKTRDDELAKARLRVGALRVLVDKAGAEVFVDDEPVGTAPLAREIGLEPDVAHRVTAFLGAERAARHITIPAGEQRVVRLTLAAPRAVISPPTEAPRKSAPPVVPSVAPSASPVWPVALMFSGVAVAVIGVGVGSGAYITEQNARDAMDSREPSLSSGGCGRDEGFALRCAEYLDAARSARTASTVGVWAMTTGITAGAVLFGTGVVGERLTGARGRVQVAPTVGGVVIRGAF